jgi:hypothetical protein
MAEKRITPRNLIRIRGEKAVGTAATRGIGTRLKEPSDRGFGQNCSVMECQYLASVSLATFSVCLNCLKVFGKNWAVWLTVRPLEVSAD